MARVRLKKGEQNSWIKILGLDPAFSSFGLVAARLDLDTLEIDITELHLHKTEKMSGKGVRVSSDNLRRARSIHSFLNDQYPQTQLIFSEIPQGSQSAKASTALGIALGIISATPIPIIEVTALEVKLAATGKKNASKRELIDWATSTYPDAGWLTQKRKGELCFINDNEHLADAIAVIHAGILTSQFKQVLEVIKSIRK